MSTQNKCEVMKKRRKENKRTVLPKPQHICRITCQEVSIAVMFHKEINAKYRNLDNMEKHPKIKKGFHINLTEFEESENCRNPM